MPLEAQAMKTAKSLLAVMILWSSVHEALACPIPESGPWLGTAKPVVGIDVKLTSKFGMLFHPLLKEMRMHTGIDWGAAIGTPVIAAGQGTIVSVGRQGFNGNTIIIDHGDGRRTLYAHLSEFSASVGDCVEMGRIIGKVGATGLVSGPSLHFETLDNGQPIDPLAVPTTLSP
jgi:murein DD-endopeptidase MepM/ murein hydrolase activator NlpD